MEPEKGKTLKILLLSQQILPVPAGTEIEVDDGKAALLIEVGAAQKVEDKPAEKKTTAKKKG